MEREAVTGVILAGGRGRRLENRDKGLVELAGRPLVQHVIDAMRPQTDQLLISANNNLAKYCSFGLHVVMDNNTLHLGPLAGIAAAMKIANTPYIFTTPCDSPFIPPDLVTRMYETTLKEGTTLCVARDQERLQPLFALIPRHFVDELTDEIAAERLKVHRWITQHSHSVVSYEDPWSFFNINTPEDLLRAETHLASR